MDHHQNITNQCFRLNQISDYAGLDWTLGQTTTASRRGLDRRVCPGSARMTGPALVVFLPPHLLGSLTPAPCGSPPSLPRACGSREVIVYYRHRVKQPRGDRLEPRPQRHNRCRVLSDSLCVYLPPMLRDAEEQDSRKKRSGPHTLDPPGPGPGDRSDPAESV